MKKTLFLTMTGLVLALASAQSASARVVVGATVGIPAISGYYSSSYVPGYASRCYSPSYYSTPSYSYGYSYCPPPPVVVYPPPIVTYRPPVYVGAPVVSFGFNFSGGPYRHGYSHYRPYRGRW
jgi:hypothetical protein